MTIAVDRNVKHQTKQTNQGLHGKLPFSQHSSASFDYLWVNSFLARGNFGHLLIAFANTSFDPDKDQHNVGPDLDPNCLMLIVYLKDFFFEKVNFE